MTPDLDQLESFLANAIYAAKAAGLVLIKHWGKLSQVEEKSHSSDLVTIADREAEKVIIDYLHRFYPDHAFLAEESGAHNPHNDNEGKFTWAIDPLDGTTNYTHQFPIVAVSIGLLYGNEPVVAVIYNPIMDELFHAIKGGGAFLNNNPIEVSKVEKITYSLLATGFAYDRNSNPDNNFPEFNKLTLLSQGVRRMGSAALDLAYVAAGRLDGYWERGLKPWDLAAGALLVKEAGGLVSDYNRGPFDIYSGRVLATNKPLHEQLAKDLIK